MFSNYLTQNKSLLFQILQVLVGIENDRMGLQYSFVLLSNINIKIIIFNPEEQKVEHIKFSEPHGS